MKKQIIITLVSLGATALLAGNAKAVMVVTDSFTNPNGTTYTTQNTTAAQVTTGNFGWNQVTFASSIGEFPNSVSTINGNGGDSFLILQGNAVGEPGMAVYQASGSLENTGNASVELVSRSSGAQVARGLALNLVPSAATSSFYYFGLRTTDGGTGNYLLDVTKFLSGTPTSLATGLDTGIASALTTSFVNQGTLGVTWTTPGNFTVSFGVYSTTVNDLNTALTGGTAGVMSSPQWDAFGFDNFSVNSVPEPGTFAMLLGGLGTLATLAFLRRRRA